MGVLEDAIREHLDLKRRHGASEQEVERQETEALGPARREVAPPPEPEADAALTDESYEPAVVEDAAPVVERPVADDGVLVEEPVAEDPGPAQGLVEEEPALVEDTAGEPPPPAEDTAVETPPVEEPAVEEPGVEEPGVEEPPIVAEEPAEAEERPIVDQPTELFDVEETIAGDTPPHGFPAQQEEEPVDEEGDVLADTPDFLQDAPEHDRLWFEQKPPRDFDFD